MFEKYLPNAFSRHKLNTFPRRRTLLFVQIQGSLAGHGLSDLKIKPIRWRPNVGFYELEIRRQIGRCFWADDESNWCHFGTRWWYLRYMERFTPIIRVFGIIIVEKRRWLVWRKIPSALICFRMKVNVFNRLRRQNWKNYREQNFNSWWKKTGRNIRVSLVKCSKNC